MKSILGIVFLSVAMTGCISSFVETDTSKDKEAEQLKINNFISSSTVKPVLDTKYGVYFAITKSNPSGQIANEANDFLIAYSLKTIDGFNIVSKAISDSTIINLYSSSVFAGFAYSLLLMKEGEKGQFIIPFDLAYGANPPNGIPKNATLVAEIELVDTRNEDERIDYYVKKKNFKNVIKTSTGLRFQRLNDSTSTNTVFKDGDILNIKYSGSLLTDKVFDSGAFDYTYGATNLIPGFIEGVKRLKKGEKARIIMPSSIGYGAKGSGTTIVPFSPLIFEIEILKVNGA